MADIQAPQLNPGSKNPTARFWRFGLVGCSTAICLLFLLFVGLIYFFDRNPYLQQVAECQSHIQATGDALGRYEIKNGKYPDNLKELVPDYLQAKMLRCPASKSIDAITYQYFKRTPDDSGSVVLLQCTHPSCAKSLPPVIIAYKKSGELLQSSGQLPQPK